MSSSINGHPTYAADYIEGDWRGSSFLENPHLDNVMTALVNLGGEYWTLRRRLMVIESLLDTQGTVTAADIESYQPTPQQAPEWARTRDDFIRRVFSVLTRPAAPVSGAIDQSGPDFRPARTPRDAR